MSIIKEKAVVISRQRIGKGICDMTFFAPGISREAEPGQFLNIYCRDGSRLLPRPISICDADMEEGSIRVVYRIVGAGTAEISLLEKGDSFDVLGPLGRGYRLSPEPAILIGGGIGIPPMLFLARKLEAGKNIVLGYRDEPFMAADFEGLGQVTIATETGSCGIRGTAVDAITRLGIPGAAIYACGPMPMLRAVADYSTEAGITAQISLEERMACGIGACLGCIVKTKHKNSHTNVNNGRICKDGPVFYAGEVDFS